MKSIILITYVFFTSIAISQVEKDSVLDESEPIELNVLKSVSLKSYTIDSCLLFQLKKIIGNDSSCYFYIQNKSAYSFGLKKVNNGWAIRIIPIYLHHITKENNYKGYFEVLNRKFLIYNEMSNEVFSKSNKESLTINFYRGNDVSDDHIIGDNDGIQEICECNNSMYFFQYNVLNCHNGNQKSIENSSNVNKTHH